MRCLLIAASLAACSSLVAQGVVPPYALATLNPFPGLSAGPIPGSSVQQVNFIHLPSDPPNVFVASFTVTALPAANGGVGGLDVLMGRYDVLSDTFTPSTEAAAFNTSGTEFGLMLHPSGLHAVVDRLPGPPILAARPNLTSPFTVIGPVAPIPSQSYYDPALAQYRGVPQLLHVLGLDIARTPIDLATGALTGPSVVIATNVVGGTANSPSPIVDSNGELIGLSHHEVVGSDNDHFMSMDLDPLTPAIRFNDTTTWTNNGGFIGGKFFDAENSPSPYHVLQIDSYWCSGGRAPVGGTMEIRAYTPPTNSGAVYISYLLVGATFSPSAVTIPGVQGALGIGNIIVGFQLPQHDNRNGEAMIALTVPNTPALSGTVLPLQAITVDILASTLALGNTAAMKID
ncbi:MAG: hypothetical protein IT457_21965 [Planctomycetes bacterium]|nr:hypothetical protein [Planctomycetota bacterium]